MRKRWIFLILALLVGALGGWAALRGERLLSVALDGRRAPASEETGLAQFRLREQMAQSQADTRVSGWLAVVGEERVSLQTARGTLCASHYPPLREGPDARWALALHGGLGTDRRQVLDVACALSLEGYHVLTPDLYAHGASDGAISSLGVRDADDVRAWVAWILERDERARIILFGQDEGAVAALLAAGQGLPEAVAAVAADSAYRSARERMMQLLEQARPGALDRVLIGWAYRAAHGCWAERGDVAENLAAVGVPLLILHGTGDGDVPAWQGEDIAAAAGERARLCLIEGASHGMGRYADPQAYYEALLGFYDEAMDAR